MATFDYETLKPEELTELSANEILCITKKKYAYQKLNT